MDAIKTAGKWLASHFQLLLLLVAASASVAGCAIETQSEEPMRVIFEQAATPADKAERVALVYREVRLEVEERCVIVADVSTDICTPALNALNRADGAVGLLSEGLATYISARAAYDTWQGSRDPGDPAWVEVSSALSVASAEMTRIWLTSYPRVKIALERTTGVDVAIAADIEALNQEIEQ